MSRLKIASILFLASTLFLKFSSMFRDLVIAHYFGASYVVDAYNAAMIIPNAFILFMLTGMKDAFVPSYIKYDSKNEGFSHLTNIVKGTFYIGLTISVIGALISPVIIPIMFPSFNPDGTQIAIWTAAIYFFSVFLVGINAVYEGFFDAKGKYSFSTFSQTIVVLCTIGSAVFFHKELGAYSLAIGYLVGTVLSFLIKLVYLKPKSFVDWKQKINRKEIEVFYRIFIPVGLTIMVGQINLIVNNLYAGNFGEGVISYLNYAFRLVSIPQAIFGVTIATIIYPLLAKARASDNHTLFKQGIEKGLTIMFLLLAPTIAGMVLLMEEIVTIVYQRGAFNTEATLATTDVSYYYLGSVLFYSIQVIIAKGFYTLEKGNLILRVGLMSILLNIILNFIFSKWIGYQGLALSASVVGFLYTLIAFIILYRIIGGLSLKSIGSEYLKIAASTIIMGGIIYFISPFFSNLNLYLYVLILTIIGCVAYIILLYIMKSSSLKDIIARKVK
ncbi:murein biosynthesis integral membrane protein MurJ [Metabacillus idriensis]|uniref:murein biosynthesis integral membrane protein MurJ n=1 Tax=Metabacillus idriensis TaxID=324768 RepID=UPI00174C2217|nr:murein biosynthesis integral membrane protein MurJ [Metabacillus idriensis]